MSDAIVDSNGNAQIPADMLAALGACPGDILRFSVLSTGALLVRAKNRNMSELAGILHRDEQPALTIEQMSP